MIAHRFKQFLLKALLLTASISYLSAETNPTSPATEIPSAQKPISSLDIAAVEKVCQQQLKGLIIAQALAAELLTLKNKSLESKFVPTVQWLGKQASQPSPATRTLEELTAHIMMHSTITDYFSTLLAASSSSDTPTFDPAITFKQIQKTISSAATDQLPQIIDLVSTQINSLLSIISTEYQESLGSIVTQQRQQLSELQDLLQLIVIKINQSKMEQKASIKERIVELRNQVQIAYQSINQQGVNPQLTKQLHVFITAVIESLEQVGRNFSEIKPLEEKQITRSGGQQPDLGVIQQEGPQLIKRIATLEQYAEIADLTWIERSARTLNDYLISPLYRHRHAIGFGAGLGLSAFAAWYFLDFPGLEWLREKTIFGFKVPLLGHFKDEHALRSDQISMELERQRRAANAPHGTDSSASGDSFGSASAINLAGNDENVTKEGYLSKVNHIWKEANVGALPIFMGCLSATYYMGKEAWRNYRFTERLEGLLNYLKGGIYRQQALKKSYSLTPVTFDDVIGMQNAKDLMMQVFSFLENPERWVLAGVNIPTKLLFNGDTRSGKTHFANAIRGEANRLLAGKINFQFREISHEEIKNFNGIKDILEVAKTYWAPCILFIDELHLLHLQDTGNSTVYTDFLTALSGLDTPDPKRPVILIAATNKPENLGAALRQKGRFGIEIRFEYPSLAERKTFIAQKLSTYGINPEVFGIDLDQLARETEGSTFETITAVISDAFIQINTKGGTLSQELLERSVDKEIRKIIFYDNKDLPEQEQRFLSAFWAGVSVAAHELPAAHKISCVTIKPVMVNFKEELLGSDVLIPEDMRKEKQTGIVRGKVWTYHEDDTSGFESEDQRIAHIKMYLGGRAAERIILGTTSSQQANMRQWAFEQIKNLITQGIDFSKLSQKAQNDVIEQAQERLAQYEKEVEELLTKHKDILTVVTEVLMRSQKLNGKELDFLIEEVKKDSSKFLAQLQNMKENKNEAPSQVDWLSMIDKMEDPALDEATA